jgi:hypothetical protein
MLKSLAGYNISEALEPLMGNAFRALNWSFMHINCG